MEYYQNERLSDAEKFATAISQEFTSNIYVTIPVKPLFLIRLTSDLYVLEKKDYNEKLFRKLII